MPTYAEYTEAARRYDQAADDLTRLTAGVVNGWLGDPGSIGGVFTASIDNFMIQTEFEVVNQVHALRSAARTCRMYAGMVTAAVQEWREYNAEFSGYQDDWDAWDSAGQDGQPPTPPDTPSTSYYIDLSDQYLGDTT